MAPRPKEDESEVEEFDDLDSDIQEGSAFEDLSEEDQLAILAFEAPAGAEHFDRKAPAALPQPASAQSVKDLPKVNSGAFPRLIR
jgi:hypothetical protein